MGVAGVQFAALGAGAADARLAQQRAGVRLSEAALDPADLGVERLKAIGLGLDQASVGVRRGPARRALDLVEEASEVAQEQVADRSQVAQPAAQLAATGAGDRSVGELARVDAGGEVADRRRLLDRLRRLFGGRGLLARGRQNLGRLIVGRVRLGGFVSAAAG